MSYSQMLNGSVILDETRESIFSELHDEQCHEILQRLVPSLSGLEIGRILMFDNFREEVFLRVMNEDRCRDYVAALLSQLDPRDQRVMQCRGWDDSLEAMTLEQVAELEAITRERVRQIEQKSLTKFRFLSRDPDRVRALLDL